MSFAAHRAELSMPLRFYLQIEGIAAVWSTFALPSRWAYSPTEVEIDSEVYAWQRALFLQDQVDVEVLAELWRGAGEVGEIDVGILVPGNTADADRISDSVALQLITATPKAGLSCVQLETLEPTDTTLNVDDTTGWPGTGYLYIGRETIAYSGKTSTSFTGLTRAQFGSTARTHAVRTADTGEAGAYVTSEPQILNGRTARLWLCPGRVTPDGVFEPWGDDPCSSEDWEAHTGRITTRRLGAEGLVVTLQSQSLSSLLDDPIAYDLPSALAGLDWRWAAVYIGPDNWYLEWCWHPYAYQRKERLIDSGASDVTEGWYTWGEVCEFLQATLDLHAPYAGWSVDRVFWVRNDGGDGNYLAVKHTVGTVANPPTLEVIPREGTLWREMGFSDSVIAEVAHDGSAYVWTAIAQKNVPYLRLPAGSLTRYLPFSLDQGDNFLSDTGWVDDAGNDIPPFVRIGDEILELDDTNGFDSEDLSNGLTINYCKIARRGCFGSKPEEIYLEEDSREERITQLPAFPGTSLGLLSLQLLTSGSGVHGSYSTYDGGWYGSGAGIDDDLLNVDSFLEADELLGTPLDVVVTQRTTWRELLAKVAVGLQALAVELNEGSGDRLGLRVFQLPQEAAIAVPDAQLDHSSIDSMQGVGWERSEDRLANRIVGEVGVDRATGDAIERITHVQGTSAGTYGLAEEIEIDPAVDGAAAGRERIILCAQYLYSLHSLPFVADELVVTRSEQVWPVNVGDVITLTHSAMPEDGDWGVEDVAALVVGVSRRLRDLASGGARRGALTVAVYGGDGWRHSWFCPTAYVNNVTTDGSGNGRFECEDYMFSQDGSGLKDIEHFEDDWRIRVYSPGNESGARTYAIADVDPANGWIDITTATAQTAPLIIEFDLYSHADTHEDQRHFAHMSDGDGELSLPVGSDNAFQWS